MVSRRRFLAAGGGSVLLAGCPLTPTTPVPLDSPLRRGSFPVGRAILGVTPGTSAVPVPGAIAFNTITRTCGNIDLPAQVPAMVYYPAVEDSDDLQRRIDFWIALPRPLPTTVPPPVIP